MASRMASTMAKPHESFVRILRFRKAEKALTANMMILHINP